MDPAEQECDFVVDLESGNRTNLKEMTTNPSSDSAAGGFIIFENGAALIGNISNIALKEEGDEKKRDRRKTMSAKKPPRPPRPSKALSLDAADQKLIKELTELAMMKRARIERMKAMKKMKVSKNSASTGNLLAMICTIIFCLVIIFQGVCPGKTSAVKVQGVAESAEATNSRFSLLHYRVNTRARDATDARLVEQASASYTSDVASRSLQ